MTSTSLFTSSAYSALDEHCHGNATLPKHVAIIMDGNGRWAKQRGLPRLEGHRRGKVALRKTLQATQKLGIQYLTVYAFSNENWNRPSIEIKGLMALFRQVLQSELAELHQNGVRVRFIGRRSKLSPDLVKLMQHAEDLTQSNQAFHLVIAIDYGARDDLTSATRKLATQVKHGILNPEDITESMISNALYTHDIPDPDLLIRTSSEQRLSNFLLWQLSYTEMVFLNVHWPDFDETHLTTAIEEFQSRARRFGGAG
ncbi:MAG: isoprenyl transferase [Pseudomonadota bacterium]